MQCRQCGTEIADKALICYRCGTPTTDAKFKPPPEPAARPGLRSSIASVLALALLVVLALYMGRLQSGETPRIITWAAVGVALVIVILRAYARRR